MAKIKTLLDTTKNTTFNCIYCGNVKNVGQIVDTMHGNYGFICNNCIESHKTFLTTYEPKPTAHKVQWTLTAYGKRQGLLSAIGHNLGVVNSNQPKIQFTTTRGNKLPNLLNAQLANGTITSGKIKVECTCGCGACTEYDVTDKRYQMTHADGLAYHVKHHR